MGSDLDAVEHDTDFGVVGADEDGLADQGVRHRVGIGVEADARFLRYDPLVPGAEACAFVALQGRLGWTGPYDLDGIAYP